MKTLHEKFFAGLARPAILMLATALASENAVGATARINLNVSVTVLSRCVIRASVVDLSSSGQIRSKEPSSSRQMGVRITTCDGDGTQPVTMKSMGADGVSHPLAVEADIAVGDTAPEVTRFIPVSAAHSVLLRLPPVWPNPTTTATVPGLIMATVSF